MRIYWTYRSKRIWTVDLWNISLNWTYTPSFYLDGQFADYKTAGLTRILDLEIPEERYTWEIVPWVKKLTRFIIWEYNETYVNWVDFEKSIKSVGAEFQIETFVTIEEARQWIRDNTSLIEETPWNFILNEATEMMWEIIPKKYLIID